MAVTKSSKCPKCFGLGKTASGQTCPRCKGTGEVEVRSKRHGAISPNAPQQRSYPQL